MNHRRDPQLSILHEARQRTFSTGRKGGQERPLRATVGFRTDRQLLGRESVADRPQPDVHQAEISARKLTFKMSRLC